MKLSRVLCQDGKKYMLFLTVGIVFLHLILNEVNILFGFKKLHQDLEEVCIVVFRELVLAHKRNPMFPVGARNRSLSPAQI